MSEKLTAKSLTESKLIDTKPVLDEGRNGGKDKNFYVVPPKGYLRSFGI